MNVRCNSFILLALLPGTAFGLIVFDASNRTDNTFNTTAPINGSPSSSMAQQQRTVSGSPTIDSSAVYIGNGYVLTANFRKSFTQTHRFCQGRAVTPGHRSCGLSQRQITNPSLAAEWLARNAATCLASVRDGRSVHLTSNGYNFPFSSAR